MRNDPHDDHNAQWQMRGNQQLTFAPGLLNGSFEQQLTAWAVDGDGRAITGVHLSAAHAITCLAMLV